MIHLLLPLQLLADATAGGSVSEDFVIRLIPAIIAALFAGGLGHAMGKRRVMLEHPVPTLTFKEAEKMVTKEELEPRLKGIQDTLKGIKEEAGEARRVARDSQGRTHARVDVVAKELAEVRGTISGIRETTQELLRIAITKTPRNRTGG